MVVLTTRVVTLWEVIVAKATKKYATKSTSALGEENRSIFGAFTVFLKHKQKKISRQAAERFLQMIKMTNRQNKASPKVIHQLQLEKRPNLGIFGEDTTAD